MRDSKGTRNIKQKIRRRMITKVKPSAKLYNRKKSKTWQTIT